MRYKILIGLMLIIFFVPGLSYAVDYKDWQPLLPKKLDGLEVTPDGGGANISLGEMLMSDLELIYGIGERQIKIKITYESTGESLKTYKGAMLQDLVMPGFVSKKVIIQDFDCLYQNDEKEGRVSISVILKDTAVLNFYTNSGKSEQHYIDVVDTLKLKEISATI